MAQENHWPPGFNFNVEEWAAKEDVRTRLARFSMAVFDYSLRPSWD
jgi:hypothetical protein